MKKALIFALSFALACTLAACGDTDSQTGSTSTGPADTSTTESTPEPADTTPSQGEDNSGTEKVITIDDEDGTIYGTITLSSWMDTGNDEFTFADGETKNWVYWDVGLGGTCTVEPSELISYTYIHLVGYEQENGVYFLTEEEGSPYHRLFADGEIHNIAFGDQGGEYPTASYGHPAYFTLGTNDGGEPNVEGDLDDFTLKADGTMYLLEIEFYGEDGEYLYSCPSPFFVQGGNEEEPQSEGNTIEIEGISFIYPEGIEATKLNESTTELSSGEARLEISVTPQEYTGGFYDGIVEHGTKGTSSGGDLYYYQADEYGWTIATDSGLLIDMTGDGDWQSIAGAVEWSVIQ